MPVFWRPYTTNCIFILLSCVCWSVFCWWEDLWFTGLARSISSRRPTLERQNSMERLPGADLANDSMTSEYEKSVDIPYAVPDHIGSTPLSSTSHFLSTSLSADDSVFGLPRAPSHSFDSPLSDNCPTPNTAQQSATQSEHKNSAFGESSPWNTIQSWLRGNLVSWNLLLWGCFDLQIWFVTSSCCWHTKDRSVYSRFFRLCMVSLHCDLNCKFIQE